MKATPLYLIVFLLLFGFTVVALWTAHTVYAGGDEAKSSADNTPEDEKMETLPDDEQEQLGIDNSDMNDAIKNVVDWFGGLFNSKKTTPSQGTVVQVRGMDWAGRPVDGTVTLTDRNGNSISKATIASRITIFIQEGGTYTLTFTPVRGVAPPLRTVEIPANHITSIVVRALEPENQDESLSPPAVTARLSSTSRDLSRGTRLVVQGSVIDEQGRPTDAFIRIMKGTEEVGHVNTTASEFSMYDLEPGEYSAAAISPRPRAIETYLDFRLRAGISRLVLMVKHSSVNLSPSGMAIRANDVIVNPDLAIKSFRLKKERECKNGVTVLTFEVTIENRGTKDSPNVIGRPMLKVYSQLRPARSVETPLAPIVKGKNSVVDIAVAYSADTVMIHPDSQTFIAEVDPQRLVDEQNENNNRATTKVWNTVECGSTVKNTSEPKVPVVDKKPLLQKAPEGAMHKDIKPSLK